MPEEDFCPEAKKRKPEMACQFRHFCDGVWKACKYWASGCTHPDKYIGRKSKKG